MKQGTFFVFEGIDKSGKETQSKLLAKRLQKSGQDVILVHFPQYGEKSAGLVENYLEGKYGSAQEVGPYRASIFYAVDRYDKSFDIRKALQAGKIVIADRYWASNIGHQGGKIRDREERNKFIRWLYELEFKLFSIPKPDLTLLLKTSVQASKNLSQGKLDIHEKDEEHEQHALETYLETAKIFPQEFSVIECLEDNQMLSPEAIHEKVWDKVKTLY